MTDINQLFAHQLPAETLVALDVAISCFFNNLKNHDPIMAKSLAMDLQEQARQVPLHLPEHVHGASDVLNNWARALGGIAPTSQGTQKHN